MKSSATVPSVRKEHSPLLDGHTSALHVFLLCLWLMEDSPITSLGAGKEKICNREDYPCIPYRILNDTKVVALHPTKFDWT